MGYKLANYKAFLSCPILFNKLSNYHYLCLWRNFGILRVCEILGLTIKLKVLIVVIVVIKNF